MTACIIRLDKPADLFGCTVEFFWEHHRVSCPRPKSIRRVLAASARVSADVQIRDAKFILTNAWEIPHDQSLRNIGAWVNSCYQLNRNSNTPVLFGHTYIREWPGFRLCPLSELYPQDKFRLIWGPFVRDFYLQHNKTYVLLEHNRITDEWFLPSSLNCVASFTEPLPGLPCIRHVGSEGEIRGDTTCSCFELKYVRVQDLEDRLRSTFWADKIAGWVQQTEPRPTQSLFHFMIGV